MAGKVVVGSVAAGVAGCPAGVFVRRFRTCSCATIAGRVKPMGPNGAPPVPRPPAGPTRAALPAMCSESMLVLTMYRIGLSDSLLISAMTWGTSAAGGVSTSSTPSFPICTVILGPAPTSMYTLPCTGNTWSWASATLDGFRTCWAQMRAVDPASAHAIASDWSPRSCGRTVGSAQSLRGVPIMIVDWQAGRDRLQGERHCHLAIDICPMFTSATWTARSPKVCWSSGGSARSI